MGGTTITIQEDNLLKAINKLIETQEKCNGIPLWLDGITILIKNKKEDYAKRGKYITIGNKGIEMSVGLTYQKEKLNKNIVIFAHFGK